MIEACTACDAGALGKITQDLAALGETDGQNREGLPRGLDKDSGAGTNLPVHWLSTS